MSIADKLATTRKAKLDIKQALEEKEIDTSTTPFTEYHKLIKNFKGGDYSIGDVVKPQNIEVLRNELEEPEKMWEFEITGLVSFVNSVAVDTEGYVYSGSRDQKVMKISPDGDKVWEFTGHTRSVNSVAVDTEGYVYSGSDDQKVMKIDQPKAKG